MQYYGKEIKLSDNEIKTSVDEVTELYIAHVKRPAYTETAFRIAFEELLLKFRDFYGADSQCQVLFFSRLGKPIIELSQLGDKRTWVPCDEEMQISYDILARLGVKPRYTYSFMHHRNCILWESLKKVEKGGTMRSIVISIVLAVICGLILNRLTPDTSAMIIDDVVSPLFEKLTLIFSAVATPLVFFAVISGINGIGDVNSFGKIGSRLIRRMGLSYLIAMLFMGIGFVLSYGVSLTASTAGGSGIGEVIRLVLDIVPDNLLAPFTIDNDLQVIVIAIFIGVIILGLGNKLPKLNEIIKELSELSNKMMMACCKLLPGIVFFGVVKLIGGSNAEQLMSIGKILIVYVIVTAVFMISMAVRACIVTKVPFTKIFPSQLPTIFINVTTQSQVAALPENMKCCKEKFGIDEKLVDFSLPLGIVVYMPSGAICIGITAFALSWIMGVPVTIAMLIRILLLATVLAISAPPIPGSALIVIPIMLTACAIPAEALPLAIIFGSIVGYFLPTFNGFNIQLELLMTAW
ncbi:MAG: cation:dicarboxylase symporter family transporter, partial [Lachnospiraceae bacterium]|nr:cation:dicarboxylase symporter family transporter [Candidatus Minthocola equi]